MTTAARDRTCDASSSSLSLFAASSSSSTSSSSPIVISDPLAFDPNPHHAFGSRASGSFQNEGLLADNSCGGGGEAKFGFLRAEFRTSQLVETVEFYERHVFFCYKNPTVWPPRIEAAEFDRLPRLLYEGVIDERRAKGDELQSDDEGSVSRKESNDEVLDLDSVSSVAGGGEMVQHGGGEDGEGRRERERGCSTAEVRLVKEGERERF